MRPLLIYNYEHELINKKDEFMELFMREGEMWEKMYLQEQYDPDEIQEARTVRGHSIFRRLEDQAHRNSVQRVHIRNSGLSITSKTPAIGPKSPAMMR